MFAVTLLISTMLPQAVSGQRAVAAPAVQVRPVPDEAVRRQVRLSTSLAPSVKMKIAVAGRSLSQSLKGRPAGSQAQLQDAARAMTLQAFPGVQGADLDALLFLVMSAAAQEQQAELQDQINQMQQQMAQKKAQRDSLDSMNDMSEMQQMKLQQMMDQRSKMLEALSNVMKKTSDTQSTIIQNMK